MTPSIVETMLVFQATIESFDGRFSFSRKQCRRDMFFAVDSRTRCHLGLTCLHRMPYDPTDVVRDDNGCRTSCCFAVNCWETINERLPPATANSFGHIDTIVNIMSIDTNTPIGNIASIVPHRSGWNRRNGLCALVFHRR